MVAERTTSDSPLDALVVGAGVGGIYQVKRLVDLGLSTMLLEAEADLGGTWYRNRYPGARFDSESYTYGYSFSRELLDEWHWTEQFSPQPETLRYLNFVADKFDLRQHMRFSSRASRMSWSEDERLWTVEVESGEVYRSRFVITSVGVLSMPTPPRIEGMEDFEGDSFHTFYWPQEPVPLEGRRVGIIGTGATGIQVIGEIADQVGVLKVFQRRPNWSIPLNNSPISEQEMAAIRARYDEIFENCAKTPGGFEHQADRRGFENLSKQERHAFWDELYDRPGFAMLLANFPETYFEPEANRELSEYVANRIRQRVKDPAVAEKLIPRDHGFGMQRLPLETNYFEAYNHDHVHLVDLSETPIERITRTGIQTSAEHHELDLIIYATGFDAITGALDRIEIRGTDGEPLHEKWRDGPSTYVGTFIHGFPNLLMVAGPQSVSGSTNYPRAIETGVDWITEFLEHVIRGGHTRFEAHEAAQEEWEREVRATQDGLPMHRSKGWFTGYNSNIPGREEGKIRYHAYWGGAPRFRKHLEEAKRDGYHRIEMR